MRSSSQYGLGTLYVTSEEFFAHGFSKDARSQLERAPSAVSPSTVISIVNMHTCL